jgi:hypothetical protein
MLTKTALLERISQNSRNLAIQEFKTAAMLQQFVPYETLICCWPLAFLWMELQGERNQSCYVPTIRCRSVSPGSVRLSNDEGGEALAA